MTDITTGADGGGQDLPKLERPGSCQHLSLTDEALLSNAADIVRSWGNVDPLRCPACNEWLYVHGDADGTVYAGEPFGAGADDAGRPSASTHPEYWNE